MANQQHPQLSQGIWKGIVVSAGLALSSLGAEPLWAADPSLTEVGGGPQVSLESIEGRQQEPMVLSGGLSQKDSSLLLTDQLPLSAPTEDGAISAQVLQIAELLADDPPKVAPIRPEDLPPARPSPESEPDAAPSSQLLEMDEDEDEESSEETNEGTNGVDPELGTLRLRLPELRDSAEGVDPELGTLRLRLPELPAPLPPSPPAPSPAARRPVVNLQGRLNYLRTDNIFSGIDPVEGGLTQGGVGLWATPALGPRTFVTAAVNGDVVRYGDQSQFNYNELRLNLGLYQLLTPRTYGEIGWTNQQLFRAADGDRFLNDHVIRLTLGRRDQLAPQLRLNTSYQLRLSFANPNDRSRLINYLTASLGYEVRPGFQTGLSYQLAFIEFTQQDRSDSYQQLTANLSYQLSRSSQVFFYGGWRWGDSSNPNLNFDSTLIGGGISINLPLF